MKITGRALWIKLKNGCTLAELASSSNMTEETLLKYLENNFQKRSVKKILLQLNKNQKLRENSSNRNHKKTLSLDLDTNIETDLCIDIETNIDIDIDTDIDTELLTIQNRIEELSTALCSDEVQRESLLSQKREIKSILRQEESYMIKLKKELKEHQEKVSSSIDQLEELSSEISKVNIRIADSRELLSALREELKSLQRISIFAYANGEFEVEPKENIEIPDYSLIFQDLLSDERLYDFSLNQIKQLAKSIAIANMLKKEDREFEFAFENENIFPIFEELI